MKTSKIMVHTLGALCVSIALIACANNAQVTQNKNEPSWVNDTRQAQKEANEVIVGVGSSKLLDGNVDYSTNIASMNARAQIAQTISVKLEQAIKQLQQSDGLNINEDNLIATKQKLSKNINQTKLVTRWVDKEANPNVMYVLISMNKDAYDRALKDSLKPLGINAQKAKELSDSVEELLR